MERFIQFAAETTADTAASDPLALLLQYGVLGIFAVLLIMYTRGSINREREKGDRAEAQVKELNDFIRNELLPKQVEATLHYKQVAEVLEEAIQLITEMKIRDNINRQGPEQPFGGSRRG